MAKKKSTRSAKSRSAERSARVGTRSAKPAAKPALKTGHPQEPTLLSGGNPQIAKGDGDEFVQAYIAAMPGWKREVGRRLDDLVVRVVPNARKAVRWNSPFWGIDGQGWFLAAHCITKYVKITFFRGSQLEPPPPVESKVKDVRYLHIFEGDWTPGGTLDEEQLARWIKQAAELPGETCF